MADEKAEEKKEEPKKEEPKKEEAKKEEVKKEEKAEKKATGAKKALKKKIHLLREDMAKMRAEKKPKDLVHMRRKIKRLKRKTRAAA
jgi:hypothetical protein